MSSYIRPYHPSDLVHLYKICLKTGASGKDATYLYRDPNLLGHFYAAPFAVLEPELCFVLIVDGQPSGYILGTRHSKNFYRRCEQEWFPVLRKQYPFPDADDSSADAHIVRLLHRGHTVLDDFDGYPAQLHIDILPRGQGKGAGRDLMDAFIGRLREIGVPALHLQVGKSNVGAIKFYEHMGFERIKEFEFAIAFGMRLD